MVGEEPPTAARPFRGVWLSRSLSAPGRLGLAHLALTSATWIIDIALAKNPPESRTGSGSLSGNLGLKELVDRQMAEREVKSVDELVAEIRSNAQSVIDALSSGPQALLDQHVRTPWGTEGPLHDVIAIQGIQAHFREHVRDLRDLGEA